MLGLQSGTHFADKGSHELKNEVILVLKPGREQVAHVDDDTLLRAQSVSEASLATPRLLDLLGKRKCIEVEQLHHLIALRLNRWILNCEESRL